MDHGDDLKGGLAEADARAGVTDDAGFVESGAVEAEVGGVDEGDGDLDQVGSDVLVDAMGGADVALFMCEPGGREDAAVDGVRGDVVVRIPEGVAGRVDGVPPEPPLEHLAGAPW